MMKRIKSSDEESAALVNSNDNGLGIRMMKRGLL